MATLKEWMIHNDFYDRYRQLVTTDNQRLQKIHKELKTIKETKAGGIVFLFYHSQFLAAIEYAVNVFNCCTQIRRFIGDMETIIENNDRSEFDAFLNRSLNVFLTKKPAGSIFIKRKEPIRTIYNDSFILRQELYDIVKDIQDLKEDIYINWFHLND